MNAIADAIAIARKDLLLEWRVRRTLPLACVLGVLIVVVLAMGLRTESPPPGAGIAAMWVALLFSGVLCFERTMAAERQHDAMAAVLLAPIDRGSIYFGKLLANGALLGAIAIVLTPVVVALCRVEITSAPAFLAIEAAGIAGLVGIGTLLAAAASSGRSSSGLLATLVLPLALPVVLAAMQAMGACCAGASAEAPTLACAVLVGGDIVFLVAGWMLYEVVLE